MRISENGLDLIRSFESCRLTAYPDPATGGDPWTIGVGHTGPDVHKGLTLTQQRCDELLEEDCLKVESGVSRLVTVPLTQDQFDSLVSWSFNLGLGALEHSTLLHKLNAGDKGGAGFEMLRWNRANGRVMAGLTRRREAEHRLFLGQPWREGAS